MEATKKAPRLAIVDDFNIFATDVITPPLFDQLTGAFGLDTCCYVPAYRKGQHTNGIPERAVRFVWDSVNYPFRIFSALRHDNRTEVIVMLEQGTFGPPFAMLFLPLFLHLCRVAKCRTIINLQGIIPLGNFGAAIDVLLPRSRLPKVLLRFALFALYARVFSSSDQIQVYAPTFANWVLEYGNFKEKIRIVSAGVQTTPGNGDSPSVQTPYVLAFGHVVPRKGLEYAITAWREVHAKYPSVKLVIAGSLSKDPEYATKLRSLIETSHLSETVLMIGPVSVDEMHALFESCYAAIFPYIFSDSTSGPLCTALQHRKPIVASRIGLFAHLFRSGGAAFCDPGDSNSIAEAIISLLNSQEEFKLLSSQVNQLAESLNWRAVADRFFKLIMEAAT